MNNLTAVFCIMLTSFTALGQEGFPPIEIVKSEATLTTLTRPPANSKEYYSRLRETDSTKVGILQKVATYKAALLQNQNDPFVKDTLKMSNDVFVYDQVSFYPTIDIAYEDTYANIRGELNNEQSSKNDFQYLPLRTQPISREALEKGTYVCAFSTFPGEHWYKPTIYSDTTLPARSLEECLKNSFEYYIKFIESGRAYNYKMSRNAFDVTYAKLVDAGPKHFYQAGAPVVGVQEIFVEFKSMYPDPVQIGAYAKKLFEK